MRTILVAAMALGMLLMVGAAWAANTAQLNVSAFVQGTCKFDAASADLDFGNIDPTSGADANAQTTIAFWCTKGIAATPVFAIDSVQYGTTTAPEISNGTENIPFSLAFTPDTDPNAGPTNPRTLTIDGTIAIADYQGASEGNYGGYVVLSINP